MKPNSLAAVLVATTSIVNAAKKPNILFVLTDDQDVEMKSLDYMPLLHKYLINEGTTFENHYCTVSVCCPSRVNLWTGRAAHNTNVTDLFPPYGGYPKFVQEGLNEDWLPVWLQSAGYNTYYTGKLFNAHDVDNYDAPYVNGFNQSDFLLDPFTYEYYNAKMTRNGDAPVSYKGLYSPDVVAQKALDFLDEAVLHEKPFFLGVAPVAPHSNVKLSDPVAFDTAFYAERHAHLFKDYKIPRTANFNPDNPSGVGWVRKLPKLNDTLVEYHDEFQRSRLRALQSVDEMVEQLVKKLEDKGILENTYIFYSTDNGYHLSQHRLHPGKECPYETDIHIPLIVRGPGVPAGHRAGVISSHTDLTPTMLKIAGSSGSEKVPLDGFAIPLDEESLASPESGEHVNAEFWGRAIPEGKYGKIGNDPLPDIGGGTAGNIAVRNNTWKALRVIGNGYNILYTVWCFGDREFYDVGRDPDQMINLLGEESNQQTDYTLAGRPFKHVVDRLDALLMVMKSCLGKQCHKPWQTLHPDSDIKTLEHALDKEFDVFYHEQPKVRYASCELGYLIDKEGPQHVHVWKDEVEEDTPIVYQGPNGPKQQTFRYAGHWAWWT